MDAPQRDPVPNGDLPRCFGEERVPLRVTARAKLEVIAMISGFATMYGAMQAASTSQPASTDEQTTAQVQALTRAAAQGRYPHLAAALAAGGPPRSHDDIFGSCLERLIDLAGPGLLPPP